jgi:Xaa-Pro dipeptidase
MRRSWSDSVSIDAAEYQARQRRFGARLEQAGLGGGLVVSRGGGTFDRCGDVLYLTGHYQSYAYMPETPGLFSGRSHAVAVVGTDGECILCVSVPEYDVSGVVAADVRYGEDFASTVADAVATVLGRGAPIGLVGADVLPLNLWERLVIKLGEREWRQDSELLGALRRIKSPAELDAVRASAASGRRAATAFLAAVSPGARESDAVAAAVAAAVAEGAGLYFAAVSSGLAVARYTASAFPGWSTRRFEPGDLVRFDIGLVTGGYLSDFGRTVAVGSPTQSQQHLLRVLHEALDVTIDAIRPGVAVRDVVAAGDRALAAAGVSMGAPESAPGLRASYPAHWGHGLGLGWERPWLVSSEDLIIQPAMVLAVERAITLAGTGTAAAEQNLIVTETGVELLTAGQEERWS